jgi:predicted MPP superfamily phosphohydrolase
VQIPLAKLPRRMDGLRIATVADIHLGPLAGRAHAERVVAAINRLDADIVAVVGDLVDGSVAELGEAAAPVRDLRARYGSFFVTGNHEYYSGVEEWVVELDRLGLEVLQNERREIAARGGVLDLAGVNDPTGDGMGAAEGPDFDAALGGRDPSRPVVLLAHQPVQVHEAARHGVDLQLSGHTHGGQMVPFNLVVALAQPVVSGLATIDGTPVYVTTGAGFWGPPVRVGVPPQVSLVELRSAG